MGTPENGTGARPKRRYRRVIPVALFLIALGWFLRGPILRQVGNVLIVQDDVTHADVIYALGGAPLERGGEAGRLLVKGVADLVVCTGGNISHTLQILGHPVPEAGVTREAALQVGAQQEQVVALVAGTSTWEEAALILMDAHQRGADTIVVVTTDFHTRRVERVFNKRFVGSGIVVQVHAAASLDYDRAAWWRTEEGLLMVNNEYVKLVYYLLRY